MPAEAKTAVSVPSSAPSSKKEGAATAGSVKTNKNNGNKKAKANNNTAATSKQHPPREYNPLWRGYLYIVLSSLISLSSISNARQENFYKGNYGVGLLFATVTFAFCLLVLILDRTKWFSKILDYAKALDGKVEGYTLLVMTFWWIVGVAYITQVNGLAYVASNIYFSAWMCLASCIYTLNEWSTNKDLLSLDELTGISETLKSWYILFLASLVVMGTCIDLIAQVYSTFVDDAGFGLAVGFLSAGLSLFWILVHYNFVTPCGIHEGGWVELCCSFIAILIWIAGTAVITREGGIGATIAGTGCFISEMEEGISRDQYENCSIIYYYYSPYANLPQDSPSSINDGGGSGKSSSSTGNSTNVTKSTLNDTLSEINGTLVSPYPNSTVLWTTGDASSKIYSGQDDDFIQPSQNLTMGEISCLEAESRNRPGSNLYLAVWLCMGASISITLRWKAQQAMQFAQTAQNRQLGGDAGGNNKTSGGGPQQPQPANATSTGLGANALEEDDDDGDDDDDDDDLDDFEDAYE